MAQVFSGLVNAHLGSICKVVASGDQLCDYFNLPWWPTRLMPVHLEWDLKTGERPRERGRRFEEYTPNGILVASIITPISKQTVKKKGHRGQLHFVIQRAAKVMDLKYQPILIMLRVNQRLATRIEKQSEKELRCDQCHLQIHHHVRKVS